MNQSEVARRVHVCRQTVSRWAEELRSGGRAALNLKKAGRAGRKPELTAADRKRLEQLLLKGPEELGYETPLWTCARVADLIYREFGAHYHAGHVWKILDELGWSCQRPIGRARERNEEAIRRWRRVEWPAIKKSPKRGAHDFIDESGISQRPHRVRAWSRRGETPILQYNFNRDSLSAVAGLTFLNFCSQLYQGSVKSAEVVDFLAALLRRIPGRLLIVWDRLSAIAARSPRGFIAEQGERWWVEHLPGHAPELNPVEYIRAYWKQHSLPNVCPKDYWSLDETARRTLKRMRRRPAHHRLLASG